MPAERIRKRSRQPFPLVRFFHDASAALIRGFNPGCSRSASDCSAHMTMDLSAAS